MEGSLAPVYDRFLDFLVEKATPQEILAFTIPESERERALVLLDKRDTGSLTLEEAIELDQMQRVDQLISALKLCRNAGDLSSRKPARLRTSTRGRPMRVLPQARNRQCLPSPCGTHHRTEARRIFRSRESGVGVLSMQYRQGY